MEGSGGSGVVWCRPGVFGVVWARSGVRFKEGSGGFGWSGAEGSRQVPDASGWFGAVQVYVEELFLGRNEQTNPRPSGATT